MDLNGEQLDKINLDFFAQHFFAALVAKKYARANEYVWSAYQAALVSREELNFWLYETLGDS